MTAEKTSIYKNFKSNLQGAWDSFSEDEKLIIEEVLVDAAVCCANSFVIEEQDHLTEISHVQLQMENISERAKNEVKKAIANAVMKRLRGLAINLAGASLGIPPL